MPVDPPLLSTSTSISSISTTIMGSVLQCIRFCLDKEEEEQQSQSSPRLQSPLPNQLERMDEDNAQHRCCRSTNDDPDNPWTQFWGRFSRDRYQHIASSDTELQTTAASEQPLADHLNIFRKSSDCKPDQPFSLRTASTFDSSKDILTIRTEEIVFPGSALQHEMAIKMSENLKAECVTDECVICMEGFSTDNPRMPTLCGCGENKTYFHLPCLYQWIDHSEECPSCREKIAWEEF
mmetsp:Transcript_7116/g.11266  ORF Transcript_7116/g.11266 Transcript_7116/m.11266 type:complete len:236 (-) Transcript_7116:1949-2656(-)